MNKAMFALGPLAALTLSACVPDALTSILGQALSSGATVSVSGTIYGPADQVAVIAAGAGNVIAGGAGNVIAAGAGNLQDGGAGFQLLARSDETGVNQAHVVFSALGSPLPAGAAVTDSDGKFTVALPGGATYAATALVPTKSGSSVTLSGLEVLGTSDDTFEIDAAENLVAAKALSLSPKSVDGEAFKECVSMMETELSSQSSAPLPSDPGAAASLFDNLASSDLKAMVQAAVK